MTEREQPVPHRLRGILSRVATRLRAVAARPWSDASSPVPNLVSAFAAVATLACAAALVAIHGGAPVVTDLPTVLALSALTCLAQGMRVRFADGVVVDTAEIFYACAFALLSPADAVVVVTIAALWRVASGRGAWNQVLCTLGFLSFTGTVGVLAAMLARSLVPAAGGAATTATVVAAVFAISIPTTMLWNTVIAVLWDRIANARDLLALLREEVLPSVPGSLAQVVAQAPMSLLGAWAWSQSHWAAPLLIVPNVASWYTVRQAANLAEAKVALGTDALTGLGNRTRFFERADDEIEIARRYGHGLAIVMGDLDNFKRVNDTYGHLDGDEVLRRTATALTSVLNDAVFPLGRYGGEEFVFAVPVLSRSDTLVLAERVRAAVEESLTEWSTTISLGVSYLEPTDRLESLIDRADKALYSAKYAGKNRVHEWTDTGKIRAVA